MAMQISGNYDHSRTNYAEQVKEKQAAQRDEEANKETDKKESGKLSELQDEYISSEKSGKKPTGLYRIGQDESGNRKIFFDDPGKPAEKCTGNTDKVEREIRKLKEKKRELEQQLRSASGDEKKVRELEKKLAQVENELSQKDNDTYRRQNTSFSE